MTGPCRSAVAFAPDFAGGALKRVIDPCKADEGSLKDEIVDRLRRAGQAFSFTPFLAAADMRGENTLAERMRAEGVTCGGAVATLTPGTMRVGSLSVIGAQGEQPQAFDARFIEIWPVLRLAALPLAELAARILRKGSAPSVSAKEAEVLCELAKGKRPAEIAVALGKSESTVRNQIDSAKARLGVRTSIQAVATALSIGAIKA